MACILHFPFGYYSQDKHLNTGLKADERREGDILFLCSPLLLLKWLLFTSNPASSMFLRQDSLLSPSFLQNVRCKKWSPWRWPVQVSSSLVLSDTSSFSHQCSVTKGLSRASHWSIQITWYEQWALIGWGWPDAKKEDVTLARGQTKKRGQRHTVTGTYWRILTHTEAFEFNLL